MVVMLNQCCCGCTLKTGTIIIAVLELLGSLSCLGSAIKMATGLSEVNELKIHDENGNNSIDPTAAIVIGIIMAVMAVISLALSIMLLMGANNENPRIIKPWLVYSVVCQVLSSILSVILAILTMVAGTVAVGVFVLFFAAIVTAIAVYFILVVYSFYRQLLNVPYPSKI